MSNQKLFITGGSGYIGSVVIEYAIAEGFLVTALSRTPESDVKIKVLGATPVRGDLKSHDVLTREASKADAVINIADVISSNYAIAMDERFQINNDAIDALAAGLKGSDKPLVLTSGTVYAAPDSEGKETDESNPGCKSPCLK
jgi:nucleoside-diphosphate-sugar epimerase